MQDNTSRIQHLVSTYGVPVATLALTIAMGRLIKFTPPQTLGMNIVLALALGAIFGALNTLPGRRDDPESATRFYARRFAPGVLTGVLMYAVIVVLL